MYSCLLVQKPDGVARVKCCFPTMVLPYHVFISFRVCESVKEARILKKQLESIGVGAFVSQDDIQAGNDWRDSIAAAFKECRVFIVLGTMTYGAKGSDTQGTMEELLMAKKRGLTIIVRSLRTTVK